MKKRQKIKSILSLLLCAVMIFGVAPLAGIVGIESADNADLFTVKAEAMTTEGTEGFYSYVINDGEATITYVDESLSGDVEIPSVLGGYPVTCIENTSFECCTNITGVSIPDSVKSIGNLAFRGCKSLEKIKIPDSVTEIYSNAFFDTAYYNNEANWKNGVLYIGNNLIEAKNTISRLYIIRMGTRLIAEAAFQYCENLKKVIMPNSVKNVCKSAFSGCTSLEYVKFSKNITEISDTLFRGCKSLESITIPDSVTSIGEDAFEYCSSLESITLPDSVTSIGSYAFEGTAYYNNEANWENDVLYIGNHLIRAKGTISGSYAVKDGTKTIASDAFYNCTSLESITIPNSVTGIEGSTFLYCTSLKSITIPDSVTSIGEDAFEYCSSLESITVDSNNKNYSSDEYGVLFNKDKTELIQYPTGNSRTSYTIPNSVTSIGYYAFYGCKNLESITIPNSVTSIGDYAFSHCTSLESVTIPDSVTSIGDDAFEYCISLESVTIPNGVTSIGGGAFRDCISLTSITIPDSVTSVGDDAFYGCTSLESITIPNSVTSIGDDAFYGCTSLASIIIPNSVTSIGNFAFFYCTSLESITFGENSQLTSIGSYAFSYCTSLKNISIPNSVTSIGNRAFCSCTSFESITIPDSVTSIDEGAFAGCSSLESITISDSVTSIEIWAFSGTAYDNNESNWENSVLYIGNHLIQAKGTISGSYAVKAGTKSIADYAFYNCTSLENVTIPNSVTSIGDNAFYNCTSLESITVDSNNKNYSSDEYGVLFNKDKTELIQYPTGNSRTSYTIPNSVTSIGSYAFYECTSLESTTIPNSVTSIGDHTFSLCTSLSDVYYSGSEEAWNEIMITDFNESLDDSNIHFNSTGVIKSPSQTSIACGDSMVLSADETKIPAGGCVKWTADNGKCDFSVSDDGLSCKVTPKSIGTTLFTATVFDANGNAVLSDTQKVNVKVGFCPKILSDTCSAA